MIEKTSGFMVEGRMFPTLAEAQKHELEILFGSDATSSDMARRIVENAAAVLAILTSTGRKPRERKKKPGRPKGSRNKPEVPAESNGQILQQS
jgi:hypothetical protein